MQASKVASKVARFAAVGPEGLKVLPRAKEKRNLVRSPAKNMF